MIGLPSESKVEQMDEWFRHVHADDVTALRSALQRHLRRECTFRARVPYVASTARTAGCCAAVSPSAMRPAAPFEWPDRRRISRRRRIQDELSHAALHDSLTGLANRSLFAELLDRALMKTRRASSHGLPCSSSTSTASS